MKKIPLTQGKEALVDDRDFKWLNQWKWYFHDKKYATRKESAYGEVIRMHRLILGAKKGQICDHINGDKLDNRRKNLRFCTPGQNVVNAPPRCDNTSGYKGVAFHKRDGRWTSSVFTAGKRFHLGYFKDKKEAARAYNKAAKKLFGKFANLNTI